MTRLSFVPAAFTVRRSGQEGVVWDERNTASGVSRQTNPPAGGRHRQVPRAGSQWAPGHLEGRCPGVAPCRRSV